MIILESGANNVILTLSEKVTISNPYFLFALSSIQTNSTVYFLATDISNYTERYNKFIWTIKTNPNNHVGEFLLPIEGLYSYTAYQLSSPQLTPPNGAVVLEVGNVQFGYTEQDLTIYNLPNTTIKVYE
jgi:hypothetical protein